MLCGCWSESNFSGWEICRQEARLPFQAQTLFLCHLTIYKAQIHFWLEYSSHLWRRASKHYSLLCQSVTLDAIQKRAIRLIDGLTLLNRWPIQHVSPPFSYLIDSITVCNSMRDNINNSKLASRLARDPPTLTLTIPHVTYSPIAFIPMTFK